MQGKELDNDAYCAYNPASNNLALSQKIKAMVSTG